MPFVDETPIDATPMNSPPLPTEFNFPRETVTPGWNEVLQAEFETNNIIGSISADRSGSGFVSQQFDPTFSLADELRGTEWENNPQLFATARNRDHFHAIMADLERDRRNRQTLADSTWGQYLPAMILGQALDPVNWLSLGTVGALRLAGRGGYTLATRTGAIATGVAVDTAAQEVILQASQQNRTLEESLIGIGGSFVLGGLIGHVGSRLLLRSETDALSRMLQEDLNALESGGFPRGNLSGDTAGVGAQRLFNEDGTPSPQLRFSFGLDYLSQRMGPQQRLVHSISDAARRYASELIEMPYFFRENRDGFIVAPRGDAMGMPGAVQTRIGLWEEPIMRAVYGMRDLYLQYRGAEHQNFAQRAALNIADRFGRTDGAMGEVDFRRAVYDAVNDGGNHEIPQVAQAAKMVLDVAKQVEEAGRKAGVVKEGQSVIPRSWLVKRITDERPRFRNIVINHLRSRRSQLEGQWQAVERERAVRQAERVDESDDARIQREINLERDKAAREAERAEPLRYEGLPLVDEEIDTLVSFWSYMREVYARPKPESLTSFIVRTGGLEDPGGDVRAMLGGQNQRPGLIRKGPEQAGPGMAGLGDKGTSGRTLDDVAMRAWEHGFFPDHIERPTINDLLDRLGDDLHTGRVVRRADEEFFEDLRVADEYAEELSNYGVNPRDFRTEASFREYFGQRRPKGDAAPGAGAPRPHEGGPAEPKLTDSEVRLRNRAMMEDADLANLADTIIERMTLVREGRTAHDLHTVRDADGFMRDDATLTHEDFALPYTEARDFLERDIEMLMRMMHRSMVPDIEIAARFGSADAGDALRARKEEGTRAINAATSPKERQRLERALKRDLQDMADTRDRLAGRYGLPQDPTAFSVRAGRLLRDVSVVQKMGLAALASIPETARLITARGLGAVFSDLLYPMLRDWSKLVEAGHDLRMATHAMDHHTAGRAMAIADGAEDWGNMPKVDRFSREATKTFMRWTGLPKLTDWQKSAAGVLVSKNILEAAIATRAGTATRKQTETLSRLAISRENAITIAEQFDTHGVKDDARIWAAEANKWDAGARPAREAFLGGIRREVNRLITTPGLDTPNILASESGPMGIFGKMLLQYKSFAISSYERVLVTGLQQNDVPFWTSAIAAVGLAFLVNEGRKAVFPGGDPRRRRTFEQRWNDPRERNQMFLDAVDRAGIFGWLGDPTRVMERAGLSASNLVGKADAPQFSRPADVIMELAGAPISGAVNTGYYGLRAAARIVGSDRSWSEADTRRLERSIPFVGLHWMRLGLEQLGANEALNRALDARSPR